MSTLLKSAFLRANVVADEFEASFHVYILRPRFRSLNYCEIVIRRIVS